MLPSGSAPPMGGAPQAPAVSGGGNRNLMMFRKALGVPDNQPAPEEKVIAACMGKFGPQVKQMAASLGQQGQGMSAPPPDDGSGADGQPAPGDDAGTPSGGGAAPAAAPAPPKVGASQMFSRGGAAPAGAGAPPNPDDEANQPPRAKQMFGRR